MEQDLGTPLVFIALAILYTALGAPAGALYLVIISLGLFHIHRTVEHEEDEGNALLSSLLWLGSWITGLASFAALILL